MGLFMPADYVPLKVTTNDLVIASLTWGFTLGFGFMTVWSAIKQTTAAYKRKGTLAFQSPYIIMVWGEILVCLAFSIACWMYLMGYFEASFAFYFSILTIWALQVQFLLQIIINRIAVLLVSRRKALYLKIGVAVLITSINISVYCIWLPARLQVSQHYIDINKYWDRIEKTIYLMVDASLNWYFIKTVRKQLLGMGLTKYGPLVRFNLWIIGFSLGMDVLIIGMMSLHNSFVYMQFHPLAYIVKLNIEMSMADLIAKLSRAQNPDGKEGQSGNTGTHTGTGTQGGSAGRTLATFDENKWKSGKMPSVEGDGIQKMPRKNSDGSSNSDFEMDIMGKSDIQPFQVHEEKEIKITTESLDLSEGDYVNDAQSGKGDSDERPLRDKSDHLGRLDNNGHRLGPNIGSSTKVWGGQ